MKRESLHQQFEIIYSKTDECPITDTKFNFFQFVHILSGEGTHEVNGNRIAYQTGTFLLLTPHDYHTFFIEKTTEFLLIRFNQGYIKEYTWKSIDHIECLLRNASHVSGCIIENKNDKSLVSSIVASILHNLRNNDLYNNDLNQHLVNALIVIAARNIAKFKPENLKPHADKRILDIIAYIQTNIYNPDLIKSSVLCEKFGVSVNYLSTYFKEQCGETLSHFIAQYRLQLIEYRLKYSDIRINELVEEFGFTDESHINKFFKKHKGVNMGMYRKQYL
ncbi:AraC family transcriptional regulator [Elizabethkingia sp. YR214]|uniref:helix-turn-helix domain-containing protein n=1 Tax=Elizabethkingia sp. YR214 TaxID=2135667 RepID=UPI000D309F7C|nr:AraC family transcriptional regulator [Elizabethkingia sp. YR214]PUB34904.1 AraC family transcriptional regulator [Elizabethkingia sp. YR214]